MRRPSPLALVLIAGVRLWRRIVSPSYGNVCKYHPSCSAYGLQALQVHGALRGGVLIVWRLLRCNPWSPGGYDPVPGSPEADAWRAEQALSAGSASPTVSSRVTTPDTVHDTRGEI